MFINKKSQPQGITKNKMKEKEKKTPQPQPPVLLRVVVVRGVYLIQSSFLLLIPNLWHS
jgi:hypothetical protein